MVLWWRGCHWWANGGTDVIVMDVKRQSLCVFLSSVSFKRSQLTLACLRRRARCIKDDSYTEDLRAAIDHRAPSSNRLKYAVIHTSAVLTENYTQTQEWKTLIPISSLSKHASASGLHAGHRWALQVPAAIVWKVLFSAEGIRAAVFSCQVELLSLRVNSSPNRTWCRWKEGFILRAQQRLEKAGEAQIPSNPRRGNQNNPFFNCPFVFAANKWAVLGTLDSNFSHLWKHLLPKVELFLAVQ